MVQHALSPPLTMRSRKSRIRKLATCDPGKSDPHSVLLLMTEQTKRPPRVLDTPDEGLTRNLGKKALGYDDCYLIRFLTGSISPSRSCA